MKYPLARSDAFEPETFNTISTWIGTQEKLYM